MIKKFIIMSCILSAFVLTSCVSTKQDVVSSGTLATGNENAAATYAGLKRKVAIARFSNETQYAKGAFYDKENDPMSKQASDILSTKLANSGKFIMLERSDLDSVIAEKQYSQVPADFIIVGSVTQYGRRNEGETGLLTRSLRQIVEASVSIRLIDTVTGQIVYAEEGSGEAVTENTTTMGLGGRTGYDATLDDKAISAAISKLVENIINNCMDKPWRSYLISYEDDAVIISGGKSMGIKPNDTFDIYEKGKLVKNPATGMMIELPGKKIGSLQVISSAGNTAESEYSFVKITSGIIDSKNLSKYEIMEAK